MISRRLAKNGWTGWHFLDALGLTVAGVLLTFPAWADIAYTAMFDPNRRYILLVPLVAAWLAWVRRSRLQHCRPRGSWVGFVLICVGSIAFALGPWTEVRIAWHGGALLVTVGAVSAVLGRDVLVKFLPVFAVLALLVPLPPLAMALLIWPVHMVSSHVAVGIYLALGLSAAVEDGMIHLTRQSIRVEEVCPGVSMLLYLFVLTYGFVFATPLRLAVRLLVLALAPLAVLLASSLELAATLWLYDTTTADLRLLRQFDGWVVLLGAFVLLVLMLRLLAWASVPIRRYTLAHDY